MVDFWVKALDIYFKKYACSFLNRFEDIIDFFTIDGTYPLGLDSIISNLVHKKDFFII